MNNLKYYCRFCGSDNVGVCCDGRFNWIIVKEQLNSFKHEIICRDCGKEDYVYMINDYLHLHGNET